MDGRRVRWQPSCARSQTACCARVTRERAKPKAKPKLTAKEKTAREHRRAFERVCNCIVSGEKGESVREITSHESIRIGRTKFYTMLQEADDDLADRYARSRKAQTDRMVEEIIEIADDARNDFMERAGKDGKKRIEFNSENVRRSHLRIETRKWLAIKLNPGVYGDHQTIDMNLTIEKMDDDELLAHAKKLADTLGITLPAKLLKPAGHDGG